MKRVCALPGLLILIAESTQITRDSSAVEGYFNPCGSRRTTWAKYPKDKLVRAVSE